MAAEIRSIGLSYIKVGPIAVDGGMAADEDLEALGVTYQDTAELTDEDQEETPIYSEENDDPEELILGSKRKKFKWSIINYDPDQLVRVLGGTATGTYPNKEWAEPRSADPIELSLEALSKYNVRVQCPRVKISAKINWKWSKKGVALVDITAEILTPTKAGLSSRMIKKMPPTP